LHATSAFNALLNTVFYTSFHLDTQTNLGHGHDNGLTDDKEMVATKMLVNEYFPVVTTVSNPYNVYLQNVGVHISIPVGLRNSGK